MSTLSHDSDSVDLFGHLLDYQQTDEFKAEETASAAKRRDYQRSYSHKSGKVYRKNHSDLIKLRTEARKYKTLLYEQQNGLCSLCGKPLTGKYDVDHVIPLIKGGTNDLSNLRVAHPKCNKSKYTGDRPSRLRLRQNQTD